MLRQSLSGLQSTQQIKGPKKNSLVLSLFSKGSWMIRPNWEVTFLKDFRIKAKSLENSPHLKSARMPQLSGGKRPLKDLKPGMLSGGSRRSLLTTSLKSSLRVITCQSSTTSRERKQKRKQKRKNKRKKSLWKR